MTPLYVALGIVFLWLLILTILLVRTVRHYKKLTTRTKDGSIDDILESLLNRHDLFAKDIEVITKAVDELDKARHGYYQKLGYVKFNPFNDRVAGEQSFVIALLDNKNNGLVKTFMYTRDGVRVYVKPIKEGKAQEFELSEEEKEAIRKAS